MAALRSTVSLTARTSLVAGKQLRSAPRRAAAPRAAVATVSAARPLWLPGSVAPEYLDGSLPGDYGFDPLGLGADKEWLAWFQQAELMHCRWAMIGAAGILLPDLASTAGAGDFPLWFEAGEKLNGTIASGLTLFWMQMILMNWVEVRRWMDMKNPGSVNQDPIFPQFSVTGTEVGYPGGKWFNPFSMAATPEKMAEYKLKEVKNGRLAMIAMVGFATQAFVTEQGPVANWMEHLANPGHSGIFVNMGL